MYYAVLLFIYAPAYANERIIREYLPLWNRYAHSAPCDSLLLTVLAFILSPAAYKASHWLPLFSYGRSCSVCHTVFAEYSHAADSARLSAKLRYRTEGLASFGIPYLARLMRLTAHSSFNFMHAICFHGSPRACFAIAAVISAYVERTSREPAIE